MPTGSSLPVEQSGGQSTITVKEFEDTQPPYPHDKLALATKTVV